MNAILTELDALVEQYTPPQRSAKAEAKFTQQRAARLTESGLTALERVRLNFKGHGLSRAELSARTGGRVSESTIQRHELSGRQLSDEHWAYLAAALMDPASPNHAFRAQVGMFRVINPGALVL